MSDNICLNCFKELTNSDDSVCQNCGFDNSSAITENVLHYKTLLQNRYVIGRVIFMNSESITYLALDQQENKLVEIQEFFAQHYMYRLENSNTVGSNNRTIFQNLHTKFVVMANTLRNLGVSDTTVNFQDNFSQNNTSYIVYNHFGSLSLQKYLEINKENLSFEKVKCLFLPLIDTLAKLHSLGLEHLGISIKSVRVYDNRLILTDFSSLDLRKQGSYYPAHIFDSCAAYEQYTDDIPCSSRTDIYSLATVFLYALTKELPNPATQRISDAKLMLPKSVLNALPQNVLLTLSKALQVHPENRNISLTVFKSQISGETEIKTIQTRKTIADSVPKYSGRGVQRTRSPLIWLSLSFILTITIVGGIIFSVFTNNKSSVNNFLDNLTEQFMPKSSSMTQIPDMSGDPINDWVYIIENNTSYRFNYEIVDTYSETVSVGNIIRTEPSANEYIDVGGIVKIYTCVGSGFRKLPNISGLDSSSAQAKLTELGLSVKFKDVLNSGVASGIIIGYDSGFAVDLEVYHGDVITVLISK